MTYSRPVPVITPKELLSDKSILLPEVDASRQRPVRAELGPVPEPQWVKASNAIGSAYRANRELMLPSDDTT